MGGPTGVPSSVARPLARASNKVPQRCARLGLVGALRRHGVRVADHGDRRRPMDRREDRWRPDAWRQVVEVVQAAGPPYSVGSLPVRRRWCSAESRTSADRLSGCRGRAVPAKSVVSMSTGGQDLMIRQHPREPILQRYGRRAHARPAWLRSSSPHRLADGRCSSPPTLPLSALSATKRMCTALGVAPRRPPWARRSIAQPVTAGRRALTALPASTSGPALRCRRCRCSRPAPSRHRHLWDRRATGPCRAAAWDSCCRPQSGRHVHRRSQPGSRPRWNLHPSASGSDCGSAGRCGLGVSAICQTQTALRGLPRSWRRPNDAAATCIASGCSAR